MTENESLKIMLAYKLGRGCKPHYSDEEIEKAFDTAISALQEIRRYREIGTVEECREAVEKQKPKKITIRDWNPTKCPTCGHELSTSLGDGYYKHPTFLERCPKCGQMIWWSENLEGMEDE